MDEDFAALEQKEPVAPIAQPTGARPLPNASVPPKAPTPTAEPTTATAKESTPQQRTQIMTLVSKLHGSDKMPEKLKGYEEHFAKPFDKFTFAECEAIIKRLNAALAPKEDLPTE